MTFAGDLRTRKCDTKNIKFALLIVTWKMPLEYVELHFSPI